ncbi:NYN domain-containing protein [Cupriavidus sp. D39]|uniref:NYN domain-containing protein n=1 Tax=Cupriavidus sp. D39 TaxID=2997877 RepID=UPI00226F2DA9|nr:NYN domain-containing protein [Cupriavidus sp. D39]MCY0852844.1 NYN domain-containing protein [Cupriavidus sp. D39]
MDHQARQDRRSTQAQDHVGRTASRRRPRGYEAEGVDMRIGIDVASLAFKKQVDQIVLIAGDADFVPAAKQARREGIDFILDPMWQAIPEGLQEHIDGLRSTCPRPNRGRQALQPGKAVPLADPQGPEAGEV